MKRLLITGLLAAAVALAPLSQQKAQAWGGGGFGSGCGGFQVGLNLGVNWQWGAGPCCGSGCAYDCVPSCPAYGCGYGGYGYGGPPVEYGGYPTCAAPVMAPPAAAPTGVQNAAYFPGVYGGQVPSYWYGR